LWFNKPVYFDFKTVSWGNGSSGGKKGLERLKGKLGLKAGNGNSF